MRIDVLTLFPEMFAGVLGSSILKRAAEAVPDPADPTNPAKVRPPVVSYHLHNIRDFTTDKHSKVDQPPFGGGPGMVLQCQPVWDAVRHVEAQSPEVVPTRIYLTPKGRPFTQRLAETLAQRDRLLLIAGHYEDIDHRVLDRLHEQPPPPDAMEGEDGLVEISLGDYVLSGGELPAMTLIDAVVRLLPGALGHDESAHHDSFGGGADGLLDCPHYTRPRIWDGREAPEVLLSGDHAKIAAWRAEQSRRLTAERRPDLLGPAPGIKGSGPFDSGPFDPPTKRVLTPFSSGLTVILREEQPEDAEAIDALLRAAFRPYGQEAELAAAVRDEGDAIFADVAEVDGKVVGYALWSPMLLTAPGTPGSAPSARGLLGLAPLAVLPGLQGRGIGSALVRRGITQARQGRAAALLLLGHPAYYARFGFRRASDLGYTNPYGYDEPFLALPLKDPLPPHMVGQARYCPAIERLMTK